MKTSSSPDLTSLVEEFLDYLFSIRGYTQQTVSTYEYPLRQMLKFHRLEMRDREWELDIVPLRRRWSRNNAPRTVAKKLSAVRSFLRYLRDQRSLAISLKGGDSVKVPRSLPKPLEESHIREVLDTAELQDRLILLLLYGLGLRISELSGLRREDLQGKWVMIRGKGGKVRQLPLPPTLRKIIGDYLEEQSGRYFFEKKGVPMNDAQLRYRVTRLFRRSGIKATPHQLRHSFATHLLEYGARISDVSELLGHASMATTQIYTRLGSTRKRDEYMKAHPLNRDGN